MAELEQVPTSGCCSTETQSTCCEPTDKAACCGGSAADGSCGCTAGASVADPDATHEPTRARKPA